MMQNTVLDNTHLKILHWVGIFGVVSSSQVLNKFSQAGEEIRQKLSELISNKLVEKFRYHYLPMICCTHTGAQTIGIHNEKFISEIQNSILNHRLKLADICNDLEQTNIGKILYCNDPHNEPTADATLLITSPGNSYKVALELIIQESDAKYLSKKLTERYSETNFYPTWVYGTARGLSFLKLNEHYEKKIRIEEFTYTPTF